MRFNKNNCNRFKPSMLKYKRFLLSEWMVNGFIDIDCSYVESGRFWIVIEDKYYKIKKEDSAKFQLNTFKEFAKNYNLPFLGFMTKSIVPDIDKHKELEYKARVPLHKVKVTTMVTNFYDGKRLNVPIVITAEKNKQAKFNFEDIQACIFEWLDRNNLITETEKKQYRELYKEKRCKWFESPLRNEMLHQLADESLNKEACEFLKEL